MARDNETLLNMALVDIDPGQQGWDATIQNIIDRLESFFHSFDMSIKVQGSTGSPSDIEIQLADQKGANVSKKFQLRVKVTDDGGDADATNATIAVFGSSVVITTHTASKELTIESDATGLMEIRATNGTAETFTLRIGPPAIQPLAGFYDQSLDVTHA